MYSLCHVQSNIDQVHNHMYYSKSSKEYEKKKNLKWGKNRIKLRNKY